MKNLLILIMSFELLFALIALFLFDTLGITNIQIFGTQMPNTPGSLFLFFSLILLMGMVSTIALVMLTSLFEYFKFKVKESMREIRK